MDKSRDRSASKSTTRRTLAVYELPLKIGNRPNTKGRRGTSIPRFVLDAEPTPHSPLPWELSLREHTHAPDSSGTAFADTEAALDDTASVLGQVFSCVGRGDYLLEAGWCDECSGTGRDREAVRRYADAECPTCPFCDGHGYWATLTLYAPEVQLASLAPRPSADGVRLREAAQRIAETLPVAPDLATRIALRYMEGAANCSAEAELLREEAAVAVCDQPAPVCEECVALVGCEEQVGVVS